MIIAIDGPTASGKGTIAKRVAALKPPHLKTIFSPYGWTDAYRDRFYHGGILSYGFLTQWVGQIPQNTPFKKVLVAPASHDAGIASAMVIVENL